MRAEGMETVGHLLATAACFPGLATLRVPGNDIFASGANHIAHAAIRYHEAGRPIELNQLDLSGTKLGLVWQAGRLTQQPELVRSLFNGLRSAAPQLATLSLGGNMLCEQAARALCGWLVQPHCTLQMLDISRNPLGDAGGDAFANALRMTTLLNTLNLDECMLTDVTGSKCINALRLNKGLHHLTLAWNGIEVATAINLVTAVASDSLITLSCLDLTANSFAYACGTSDEQHDTLMRLCELAHGKGTVVRLGHLYGHGS